MNNDTIKIAREVVDKLWLELDQHLTTLDYGSPTYWNIVDKMAVIAEFMDTI